MRIELRIPRRLVRSPSARAPALAQTAPTRPPKQWPSSPSKPRAWVAFKRLTALGFPRRFPIVQFPNLPLIVAFVAGEARKFGTGSGRSFAESVSYLAMTIWAYEELVHGVNWFRRGLGLAYVIILVVRVAHAVQA